MNFDFPFFLMPNRLLKSKTVVALAFLLFAFTVVTSSAFAQKNSTQKIRVKPSELASRIGSAVKWEKSFADALAKSKETGKPIFWYVPTLRGTFMDRKKEIHRYMMAGPFSWPNIYEALNSRYVPIKLPPNEEQQEKYGLVRYKFIEPGFLILDSDGTEKFKIDRLTTLHVEWFRQLLNQHTKRDAGQVMPVFESLASGNYEAIVKNASINKADGLTQDLKNDLQLGMAQFRLGNHAEAKRIWQATSQKYPEHPLAWKAAAEAEGIGPFVRGFEVHRKLPKSLYKFDYPMKGTSAPSETYTEDQLWNAATQFLLGMQNTNGGFTDSDYDFGGTDSLPNVHVAVSSIAGMAMLRALERGKAEGESRKQLLDAIKQAVLYVSNDENLNKADRDEILWAYAYRLRFLTRAKKHVESLKLIDAAMDHYIKTAVASLESVQSRRGSWYHEYNNAFVTSTALMALFEAQDAGGAIVDSQKVEKGVASLSSERYSNGAFPYSTSRGGRVNSEREASENAMAASAGRMPLCELGLYYWGKSSDEALANSIQRSFDGQANLDKALKYDDHTSTLSYGGFFFWYDMRARSEAISKIENVELRKKLAAQQRAIILSLPEIDGCFVDSHELGRVYGTAMALLSLANCK